MKYKNSHDLLVSELEKNGWENGNKPTTMRERFDERFILTQDYEPGVLAKYNVIKDFIEQELKKEREEIVEIVSKEFDRQSESCIQFGHEPILYLPDTKRIIINTIKNRYEQ